MNSTRLVRAAVLATMTSAVLVGCGGGDSNGDDPNSFKSPLSGGIWHGEDPLTGQDLYGIVNESGVFVFLREDGVVYSGTASFDKRAALGTFEGFAPAGVKFEGQGSTDDSAHGTGGISGVLDPQTTFDLNVTFLTDMSSGPAVPGVLHLKYDKLYERDSSPTVIAGYYGTNGQTALSIGTDGKVFAQGGNGCVINGTATSDNVQENSYTMSLTEECTDPSSGAVTSVTFKGLVTLDNSKSPERLIGAVTVTGTAPSAIPIFFDRL